ncbi:hypothetical protein [Paraburkholderia sp. MM5477-R1]|uniref:hypothetical protein n=1 Tax=Paraburkholderia sp. MM5477-R1 TaxID=2991062 RepID=UPI003D22E506
MVAGKFDDLSSAFDFVSYAAPMEHQAYISLDTGKIYWISDAIDTIEEEIPEHLEDPDRYLAIPHKNELDLGSSLALRFAAQQLPARYDQVEGYFQRQGAYARFKDLLEREGVLELWRAFEATSVEQALRQWCTENGLDILD